MSTQPGVKFLYLFCNDLHAMRTFYSDLLGLNEIYYSEEPDGSVAYDCDGLQFTIILDKSILNEDQGWARQPGWEGGKQSAISWSVVLTGEGFQTAVHKLIDAEVTSIHNRPEWHNYWSFPVKDPMGNTVEVVLDPGENLHWEEV